MQRQQIVALVKTDHFGNGRLVVIGFDRTQGTDIGGESAAFDHLSVKTADMPKHRQLAAFIDRGNIGLE